MSETRLRYSLFTKFEDTLLLFRDTLTEAQDYYKWIFEGLLNGQDMTQEVIDDTTFIKVQTQRFNLQEEQHRMSRIVSNNASAFLTLSEISERIHDKFEIDIVNIGKECIDLYAEVMHYTSAIEKFYKAKAEEYKNFFDSIYNVNNEKQENYGVALQGVTHRKNEIDKQGVLIRARV